MISTHLESFAEYLKQHAQTLSKELVADMVKSFQTDIPQCEIDQAVTMYNDLLFFLADSCIKNEDINPEIILNWSRENGEREATNAGELSEIISRYPPSRLVLTDFLVKIGEEFKLLKPEITMVIKKINYIVDISIHETVVSYERRSAQILKESQQEAHELAAQFVPIQDGIAILPLYGTIDHDRAAYITEKTVPRITEKAIDWLIIDFSGIIKMDGEVAGHIFNIHYMLELIGIQVIITGIRPKLAQEAVLQGIDFSGIHTCGSVMQAIQSIH